MLGLGDSRKPYAIRHKARLTSHEHEPGMGDAEESDEEGFENIRYSTPGYLSCRHREAIQLSESLLSHSSAAGRNLARIELSMAADLLKSLLSTYRCAHLTSGSVVRSSGRRN